MTDERLKEIECMLQFLKMSLKYCRDYQCINTLRYIPSEELVEVNYHSYDTEDGKPVFDNYYINVACDSNAAMILDVTRRIADKFL